MTAITGNTGTAAFKLKLQGHDDLSGGQFSF